MDELILKYLSREASAEEKEKLFRWLELSPENEEYLIDQKKLFLLTSSKPSGNKAKAWEIIQKTSLRPRKIQRRILAFLKYAAVLVIPLLIYHYAGNLFQPEKAVSFHSLEIPEGEINRIVLSDGSSIWLNSGSLIKIPSDFSPENRYVSIEGQGYFEIHRDPESPFTVNTRNARIRAFGTKFDLNTYAPDYLETTLIEGMIRLYSGNEYISELVPGEKLRYHYQGKFIEREWMGNTDFYSSWATGELQFDGVPLISILGILGKWYRVDFEINDKELGSINFSGTLLKDDDLDKTISLFTSSSDLKFSRSESDGRLLFRITK